MSVARDAQYLAPVRPGSLNAAQRSLVLPSQDSCLLNPRNPSSPSSEMIPRRPQSQNSSHGKRQNSTRRKLLCNWGETLGQQNLMSVKLGLDPIRAPYHVTVEYDLRPVLRSLVGAQSVHLVALNAEKLRRKGAGLGLDALQTSGNWIARDCICTQSGKMKPLTAWKCPGKVVIALKPFPTAEEEASVLLRVVVTRSSQDPKDWTAVGAAVLLRVDTVGKLWQPGSESPRCSPDQRLASPTVLDPAGCVETEDPECWGIRVQQVLDFHEEIKDDVERYCNSHCVCLQEGGNKFLHVCLHDPCPYRLFDSSKYDDHRGVPCIHLRELGEHVELAPLIPNVSFIVRRYITGLPPDTPDTKGALLLRPREPLKVGAYISHSGADSFIDFVETLERAFDPEDAIFVSSFARARDEIAKKAEFELAEQNEQQPCAKRCEDAEQHPCAKALQNSDRMVIVVGRTLSFTECLWCNYDIKWAREWHIASFIWPHKAVELVELQSAIDDLDLIRLVSANPEDEFNFRNAIDSNHVDLQEVSKQSREFLQHRVLSFAAAFQHAADLREIGPVKIRRLQVEHERTIAVQEFEQELRDAIVERAARIDQLEKELACLHQTRKAEVRAHVLEIGSLTQKLGDTEANCTRQYLKLENEVREKVGGLQQEIGQLEDMLQGAGAKTAQAKEELERLRKEQIILWRQTAETNKWTEAAKEQAELEGKRMILEQEALLEEQDRHNALLDELEQAHMLRDSALQDQIFAEKVLLQCQDEAQRLENENLAARQAVMALQSQFASEEGGPPRIFTSVGGTIRKSMSLSSDSSFQVIDEAEEDVEDKVEEFFFAVVLEMQKAIESKDHSWLGVTYSECVDAKNIVDWLVDSVYCDTRESAVKMGRDLQEQSMLCHVWGSNRMKFRDTKMFFRYTSKSTAALLQSQDSDLLDLGAMETVPQRAVTAGFTGEGQVGDVGTSSSPVGGLGAFKIGAGIMSSGASVMGAVVGGGTSLVVGGATQAVALPGQAIGSVSNALGSGASQAAGLTMAATRFASRMIVGGASASPTKATESDSNLSAFRNE